MQEYLENEFNVFLLGLFLMLMLGKFFGKCAKKLGFAEVTGEIIAGILLGPTFLSIININFAQIFFSHSNGAFFNIFFQFSLILMMFITGLKIDLTQAAGQLRKTFYITFFGILLPFATGVTIAWVFQNLFIPTDSEQQSIFIFPLFMGIAYSLSALPIIAKILMDVKILHTSTGAIVISTAFLVDIICWGIFTVITQLQSPNYPHLFILFGFFILLFISKKILIPNLFKVIPYKNILDSDVSISLSVCLIFSIVFQFLHLDACLGAFLAGIMLNNVLKSIEIKNMLSQWIMNFFAPLFFVSIGIKIDFLNHFNWTLVVIIFFTASLSKIAGSFIGAYLSGIKGTERLVISFTLNARGTIEIIFSTIALNLGIISNPTYVALIAMALLTSILSGILVKKIVYSTIPKIYPQHFKLRRGAGEDEQRSIRISM